MDTLHELVVPEDAAGTRLDVFLARSLNLSRGYVRRLLLRDRVQLGGSPAVKGTILRSGEQIQVLNFRHPDQGLAPEPSLEIPILAEADGLLAVDKPAGLPSHPLDYEETRSVLNALLAHYPQLEGIGDGGVQSGLLHRLDTDTSGVLLFATEQEVWERARDEFAARRVQKKYLARVHGHWTQDGEVMLRLEPRGDHMKVVSDGGREAVTRIRALRTINQSTLLEVQLITGLRHQIRVTLAHLGHPILGDRLYGSDQDRGRHLLHAAEIALLDFKASSPLPPIFNDP